MMPSLPSALFAELFATGKRPSEGTAEPAPVWPYRTTSHERRPDADLRGQGSVDWTPIRDLEELRALLVRECATQRDLALDPVQHPLFRLAVSAVLGVDSRMPKTHCHLAERPGFPSRIQRDRHRCSGTERREQEIVGSGTRVGPAEADRLVRQEAVAGGRDLLGKSPRAPPHHNDTRLHRLVHYTAPCLGLLPKLRRQ